MLVNSLGGAAIMINNYGTQLLNTVELEIGGQRIDRHSGHFMETYFELTQKNSNGNQFTPGAANLQPFQTATGRATQFQRMACAEELLDCSKSQELFGFHFNFGSVETQDLLFHLLRSSTTKLK